jgi:excisionase family DNA binding protein
MTLTELEDANLIGIEYPINNSEIVILSNTFDGERTLYKKSDVSRAIESLEDPSEENVWEALAIVEGIGPDEKYIGQDAEGNLVLRDPEEVKDVGVTKRGVDSPDGELLSVQAAADELGLTKSSVQKMIESGKLPAQSVGEIVTGLTGWAIQRKDLEKVRARPKAGRPAKQGKK